MIVLEKLCYVHSIDECGKSENTLFACDNKGFMRGGEGWQKIAHEDFPRKRLSIFGKLCLIKCRQI
jgi:hypothetical protein